jgi:predicted glutamine amidotransferase
VNWIRTCYNNQNTPSTFYSVSSVQNVPGEPVVLNEVPQNGATLVSTQLSQLSFSLTDYQDDLLSYTVTTSPNIGSASVTGVYDGTYSAPVSGLTMLTTYTWYVNVTDGSHWTRKVYTFSTGFSVDNWAYRKKITVNKQGDEQCRIYAVMSGNLPNGLLKNDLINAPNSLKKLAPNNPDGWGFAYYPTYGSVPTIVRGMIRANNDPSYDATVEQINTSEPQITLAHIRKCTNGCCVTGSDSILDPHPFVRTKNGKTWTFVHNGGISVTIGKNLIGPTYLAANPLNCSQVCADNQNCDSEVYFLLLLKNIEENNWNVTNGIVAAINQLVTAGGDTSGLNFVLSDGTNMWAFRRHSLTTHTLYYLYDSVSGYTAVASQYPSSTQGNWVTINDYELVIIKPNKAPTIINVLEYIPTVTEFTNFPVLINITDTDLAEKAQDTGNDILFTDLNFQKLDFEIESFDPTNGHLVAWVRIPTISMHQETEIYLYYGNENAESQENPEGVWDSHYMMVQHLEETSGMSLSDSTSQNNNGVPQNGVILDTTGKINGADRFDGSNDYTQISDSNTLDGAGAWTEMSAEAWIYLPASQTGTKILSKRIASSSGTDKSYQIGIQSATPANRIYAGVYLNSSATYKEAGYNTPLALNTWYHVAFTYKSSKGITLFINGVPVSTTSASGSITTSTQPLCMGSTTSATGYFNGIIDEVRISDIARDRNWTSLSYNNQNNTGRFILVGDEESSSDIIITDMYPQNRSTEVPLTPTLEITTQHTKGYQMTITWRAKIGESWSVIGTNNNVGNGTYYCSNTAWADTCNTAYNWRIEINDGHGNWYNKTLSFTTVAEVNLPPTQATPLLVSELGTNTTNEKLICSNQSSNDLNGDTIYNTYHWIKNGVSLTNLLFSFNTEACGVCSDPIIDYSGYPNDGTIIGAAWTPNGIIGGAYSFSQDSQNYITIPDNPTLDGDGTWTEMTMECWVKSGVDSQSATNILGKWMSNQPRSYQLGFDTNGNSQLFVAVQNTNGFLQTLYSDTSPLVTGTWYHVAATYKNGLLNLYVNGVLDATATNAGGAITGSTVPLRIGCRDNADGSACERFFDGSIDEVKIYPFALTTEQIHQNYLDSKDGISNQSIIVPEETEIDDTWQCEITPSDSQLDGTTIISNSLTIVPYTGYTLTISIDGSGSVTKSPNKEFYTNGEIVQLTAVPNTGSSFSHWSGDLNGPENPKSITMDTDKTVTATFDIDTFTITASVIGLGGSISPSGDVTVNYGEDKTFTITLDTGYHINDILVDGVSQGPIVSYTFTAVISNHTITASFAVNQLIIDSTFDVSTDSVDLRTNSSSQDWYESRLPHDAAWDATLLTLDQNDVSGNTGKKAGLKNNGISKNVCLTQEFSSSQTSTFTTSFDIYIDNIQDNAEYDRTGHVFIGSDHVSSTLNGPTGTSNERFVYFAFYDPDMTNNTNDLQIRARTLSSQAWGTTSQWLRVGTQSYSYDQWYTVKIIVNVIAGTYDVFINNNLAAAGVPKYAGYTRTSVEYLSFLSDSDAKGDYYVDNVFAPSVQRYTLTTATIGSGSIIVTPGESTYAYGTVMQLTAIPISGWSFSQWSGDLTGPTNPVLVTIDGNKTITATFTHNQYTINASASNGGDIQPTGTIVVYYGTDQTFTITPETGYHIEDILVDGVTQGAISSYTFFTITADHSISASFAVNTYTITASAGSGGSISPGGAVTVNYGEDKTFTINPNMGYQINDVLVDSISQGPVASYIFNTVVADHIITATFTQINYDDIIFDSNFDMGNLIDVQFQTGDSSGNRFYTARNNYTTVSFADKHWWFYFKMENVVGKSITLSIINGTADDYSTNPTQGNRWPEIEPVFSYDNINWERIPLENVSFDRAERTFTIEIKPTQNQIWLAPLPPYTIGKRDALFAEFTSSPYLTVSSLGTTPGGQELKVATITDHTYNDTNKFKAYIIAQQHAGEVPGSWNAEGMIRFLLSDNTTAQAIRRSYIFKIVPIVNVDGVYYGRSRYTPLRTGVQYDLNRWWSYATSAMPFEVKTIFENIQVWQPDCFNDLHSTINTEVGSPKEALTYSWSTSDPTIIAFRNSLKLGGWPETVTGTSGYACTQVKTRLGVLPSVSFENPHDELSTNPGVKLTVNDWMNWGKGYVKGVYHYFGDAYGTLTVTPVGSGTINKDPNTTFYMYGTSVQLTAIPDSGWKFSYWTGNLTGSENPATITINGNLTIQANFNLITTYTITASAGSGGSINPIGAVSVNYGDDKNFTISPDTGYHIADVTVDSVSVGVRTWYNFTDVQADHTITASFAINTFTITATAGTGGTINPTGAVSVNYGADQTFTITANTNYHITDVLVDTVSQGVITSYTFYNVTTTHTIQAQFAENPLRLWMPFNDNTVPIPDASNYGNVGTPYNGVAWESIYGGDYNFDGTNDYITVADNPSLHGSGTWNSLSIELWVRPDSAAPSAQRILRKGPYSGTGVNSYAVGFQTSNSHLYFDVWHPGSAANTYYEVEYTTLLTAGVWYHVVCVYNTSAGSKIYVNGVDVNAIYKAGTASGTVCGSLAQPFYIGCRYGSSAPANFFDGRIDDVQISSEALTPTVIQQHYDATKTAHADYTISASAGTGGSITPSGSVAAAYGSDVTFTITHDTGYHILDVTVDGVPQGALSSHTFYVVTANHVIIASFEADTTTVTITATAGTGGTINPTGAVSVNYGADQTFTITENTGYHILDVLVDGSSVGAVSSYPFTNVVADHTIVASFAINSYTISASADLGGNINPSGSVSVNYGQDQAFTIATDIGYHISDVLVDTVSQGAITAYTFYTVTTDHTIAASFAIGTFTITATAGTGGTITPGTITVDYGTDQTFTIAANANYHITDVLVDSVSQGAITSYTFYTVTSTHTIQAQFAENPLRLWLPFNDNTVPTPDASGYGNMGTPYNGVAWESIYGGDYNFDGTNDYISVADNSSLDGRGTWNTLSIEFWVRPDSAAPSAQRILRKGPSTGTGVNSYQVGFQSTGSRLYFDVWHPGSAANAYYEVEYTTLLTAGVWCHVVCVYDTSVGSKIYVNGVDVNAIYKVGTASGAVCGSLAQPLYIGCRYTTVPAQFFDGRIDDVQIYSEALTPMIIQQHYEATMIAHADYTISASAGTGGSISPSGSVVAAYGSYVTFTITPDTGYHILDVLVDDSSVGAVSSYTFTNVVSNRTISASFEIN